MALRLACLAALAATPCLADPASDGARPEVDLRPRFQAYGLAPREQGGRGTCSVFAVTGALEFAAAAASRRPQRLSPEFLNWASNQATRNDADGGFFSDLWAGFEKYGVCPEAQAPYQPTFDPGLKPADAAMRDAVKVRDLDLAFHWIKPWDVNTGLTPAHLAQIKATLRSGWPVLSGMRWPKADPWTGDLLNTPGPEGVFDGHSVIVVAYHDDPALPGGGEFTFRNSNNGGRDGRMTYDYALKYVNDAAWIAPAPALDTSLIGPPGQPILGRNRRVSSNMQPGWHTENLDMTWLNPGEAVEMPLMEGPGVLTHLWFTSHGGWTHELDALRLRIFWDGAEAPAVDVPLGDFFAVGHTPAVVESVPVQVSSTGALTSYWRMPFAKSARITVTNEHPDRGTGLYWQADWTQVAELPEGTPSFCARWRHEYPAAAGKDYTIADLTGRGLYVGSVLSVTSVQEGWFGEGDDFFYVDGEETPSLQGTGSEDYFNDAWGFRPRTSQWFGSPRWDGDSAGDSGICYRWHWGDAVNFTRSLKVAIEHKGNLADDTAGFFIERPDFYSSVAFWYQLGQPAPAAEPMPAWPQRRVPWVHHHALKAMTAMKSTDPTPMKVIANGLFGARPTLLWPTTTPGASLTMPLEIAEEGRYAIRMAASRGPEFGVFDLELDGKKVATADLRPSPTLPGGGGGEADILIGVFTLTKGPHTLTFHAADAASGGGKGLALELIRTLKLPPEVKRDVKTHHEAHFVRLGIGRALYAHRLAYGTLPVTLQELVDKGLMPDRYLKDENMNPLQFRREGDLFVVESTTGEKWAKKWTGLDPRR